MDVTALASLALVTGGLTETVKRLFWLIASKEDISKVIPVIAVLLGVFIAIFLFDLSPLDGLIAGLITVGLYPGIKKAVVKTIQ
ncbi:MAG TPA: hypothetical protein ENI23_12485 [bacterium]|nr:hypothetical protein [bacterium]